MPQFPPPPPPPHHQPPLFHPKPTTAITALPDFLLTALSVFILFSGGHKHTHKPQSLSYPSQPTARRHHNHLRSTSSSSIMSQNPNFPNTHNFPTPQSLSDWLKPRLPSDSFSAWGTRPGTKNVHNLWLEIADGETILADASPPVRSLEVVSIRVRDGDRVLVESHQELSDGSVRVRDRPLSEKLKAGEDLEMAVKRAIKEELGSILGGCDLDGVVRVVEGSYVRRVEERVSLSYPGLPAVYVMHIVDAVVEGLPEGEFVTEEETEYGGEGAVAGEAVSVRKHFWKWIEADCVGLPDCG